MKHLLLLLCVLCALCGTPSLLSAATPPNIVFILADDLGWRDLGCTGSTFYETPNLDRLAQSGTLFTSAYSACPVCSPTRAAILTGMSPPRTGVTDYIGNPASGKLLSAPYTKYLDTTFTTLPEYLSQAGYVSWHIGKWHLGGQGYWPEQHGFAKNIAGYAAGHPKSYFAPYSIPNLPDGPKGEYLTDRLTTEAINLLKNRDPNKPFYLNLWHYAPHTPIQAPEALIAKYKKKAADLGLDKQDPLLPGEPHPTIRKTAMNRVTRRQVQSDAVYAAMLENLDSNVGRLLQTLDDLHLSDNTIVVFTSDNGGLSTAESSPTCNLPLRNGKGWLHEGGTRVALLMRWPGVTQPGSTIPARVISTDFLPTFLAAADLPVPKDTDGTSLLPVLKDPTTPLNRPLFWHYPHYGNQGGTPGSSILKGDYKLIERYDGSPAELYNLEDDPTESQNLAQDKPGLVSELHAKLDAWRQSVNAKIPQPNPDYDSATRQPTTPSPTPAPNE